MKELIELVKEIREEREIAAHEKLLSENRDRLERIATACLQGLLADTGMNGTPAKFAEAAVELAEALIAELDKRESDNG